MLRDQDWERIDELFDAALDLPPEARARWLEAVGESEPVLKVQVEKLLEFTDTEDDRLEPNQAAAELVRELVSRFQPRDILRECSTPNPPGPPPKTPSSG
jgi:hypothetical protein